MSKKTDKNKLIVDRLKKMCRERTREINRIYYGGFSSREQCNFDGQLEIMKEIMQKSDSQNLIHKPWSINPSVHLRLDDDNDGDFIHTDSGDLTMIVFLAKTNLNSGLNLYNIVSDQTTHIKYVQNRAVIFNSRTPHKSHLNFGDNIDNGRLTLNAFIKFEDILS